VIGWVRVGPRRQPHGGTAPTVAGFLSAPLLLARTRALLTVLAELDVRPHEPVLIMPLEGPGFTEAFTATFYRDALPLPVNPLLVRTRPGRSHTQTHARLVLAAPQQLPTLGQLNTPHHPSSSTTPPDPGQPALRLR
jgi:acyl-CoA synthetase (AMP-forming)/AMP-acid ligase II